MTRPVRYADSFPMRTPFPLAVLVMTTPFCFPSFSRAAEKAPAVVTETPEKPGAYKNLPCRKNPKLTYNILLPKGYDADAKARFPAFIISSPGGNPGWLGMEKWADANGVVLVGINDSKNGDWAPVFAAQDAVWSSLEAYRIHPALRFATGQSGGAWASVKLSQRYPKAIAGVILQCHSGNGDIPARGCCAALIGGIKDTTHPDSIVREAASKWRNAGYYVQEEHLDMGHVWAPHDVIERMLANMLFYARMTNSGLSPEEKKAAAALPAALLAKAAAESDPGRAAALVSPLVDVEEFRTQTFYPNAMTAWCDARAKELSGKADVKNAFEAYADETTYRRFNEAPGASGAAVKALQKKFSGDAALKAENAALPEFVKLRESYRRELKQKGSKLNRKDWAARFEKFAKKYEDTVAAKLARAMAPTA